MHFNSYCSPIPILNHCGNHVLNKETSCTIMHKHNICTEIHIILCLNIHYNVTTLMQTWTLPKFDLAKRGFHIVLHCKNKLVVLTTEWLPWLQTSWRDIGYQRFSLEWKSNCIKQPKMQQLNLGYNHMDTITTLNICEGITCLH